jgi:hypothetical protein
LTSEHTYEEFVGGIRPRAERGNRSGARSSE